MCNRGRWLVNEPRVSRSYAAPMTLIMAYRSAMHFWMQVATSLDAATRPSSITDIRTATASLEVIRSCATQKPCFGTPPYHVLVGTNRHRVSNELAVSHHTARTFPTGAFRKIDRDLLVASPELCFLQMAHELSLPRLVEFGWFLCGTYASTPDCKLMNDKPPLTNKTRLERFLEKCQGAQGSKLALRAIRLICENSASPFETKLGILLSFPKKLGGYGFPLPVMNHTVEYSAKEQQLYKKRYVMLDLYWPQWRLGLEYDGRAYHGESDAITRDRLKNSELMAKQIEIIRVDRNQIRTPTGMFVLAKKMGRATKHYISKPTHAQWENKKRLFAQLLMGNRL